MAERRRRFIRWLLPKLIIFAVGAGLGYYVRDREADDLQEAYRDAVAELERVRQTGQEMIERGRRVGEGVGAGAKAALDSTKAAVEEIKGEGN